MAKQNNNPAPGSKPAGALIKPIGTFTPLQDFQQYNGGRVQNNPELEKAQTVDCGLCTSLKIPLDKR